MKNDIANFFIILESPNPDSSQATLMNKKMRLTMDIAASIKKNIIINKKIF